MRFDEPTHIVWFFLLRSSDGVAYSVNSLFLVTYISVHINAASSHAASMAGRR